MSRNGLLLVAHAPLATAFKRVATDMGLTVDQLAVLDVEPSMSREAAFATAKMLIADLSCDSCLVLVDLGGHSSPWVVAQMLQEALRPRIQLVAGLNVAMLATALCHNDWAIDKLALQATQRGADCIVSVWNS